MSKWQGWLLAPGLELANEAFVKPARMQKRALQEQSALQAQGLAAAEHQRQLAAQSQNAADQKVPNVRSLLLREQQDAASLGSATSLTSPLGIDPSLLKLGRKSLLGT